MADTGEYIIYYHIKWKFGFIPNLFILNRDQLSSFGPAFSFSLSVELVVCPSWQDSYLERIKVHERSHIISVSRLLSMWKRKFG